MIDSVLEGRVMSTQTFCPRCGARDSFMKGFLPETCVCRICQSQLDWRRSWCGGPIAPRATAPGTGDAGDLIRRDGARPEGGGADTEPGRSSGSTGRSCGSIQRGVGRTALFEPRASATLRVRFRQAMPDMVAAGGYLQMGAVPRPRRMMRDPWQDDLPHDECGVFGIYAPEMDVSRLTFYALFASNTATDLG